MRGHLEVLRDHIRPAASEALEGLEAASRLRVRDGLCRFVGEARLVLLACLLLLGALDADPLRAPLGLDGVQRRRRRFLRLLLLSVNDVFLLLAVVFGRSSSRGG